MDPISIAQIIGTAVSLGDVVVKCISRLQTLKSKYRNAPLIISTITGQLSMVQAALDQLRIWNKPEYGQDPKYQPLVLQIGNFLDCFSPLILSLEQRLEAFEPNSSNSISVKQKLVFLWGDKETSEFSSLLDRQANALNLLLQAVQCNTWAQQQDVTRRDDNIQADMNSGRSASYASSCSASTGSAWSTIDSVSFVYTDDDDWAWWGYDGVRGAVTRKDDRRDVQSMVSRIRQALSLRTRQVLA